MHQVTGYDVYRYKEPTTPATQFLIKNRYSRVTKGSITILIRTAHVRIEIRKIKFKVLDVLTPFLLYLKDMDRLHRFRHLAIKWLIQLLKHAGHNNEFNFKIFVDVIYLSGKLVLHVIDLATTFNSARFLRSMSAKDTWEAIHIITHDAGTNFAFVKFRSEVKIMGITCKQVPIMRAELDSSTNDIAVLQMAVKAVNDTAGPDGLVPTLLVFGAYPRVSMDSPPSPSTIRRAEAIQKAMKALRRAAAERAVSNALNTRNRLNIDKLLLLPLQSEVMVWREKNG
ncbi:hypothetical protein BU23DRAFT_584687 [Bimuria novae-zelandiae CBS 107.79]|uniref:Integrase catalytic domain-containing protein n=1 Tax=Bimuria novae-zelandiae CBS 107.79 TaxID=1447943 RepID=A0A6A5UM78_9PLEO|nr:hypothetical protein BU23DRAFT_584687 [Bimuria novae-zelandiae CBS 107.79]